MQTITDFIVTDQNGALVLITHRSNAEHVTTGASDTLYQQGIAETKTTKQLNAWVGEMIPVIDYYGSVLFYGIVKAKTVREWDMTKPMGDRLVSQKKSKQWDEVYKAYSASVIKKPACR